MITYLSKILSAWLIQCRVIDETDKELYAYAAHSLIISAFPIIITSIFGLIMEKFVESIILIIPFIAIRKYSGGYHTKSLHTCLISSCCLIIICISATSFIKRSVTTDIVVLCSIISLIIFSPIDHENRKLDEYEKKKYKKTSSIIAILFGIIYLLLALFKADKYAVCISIGLILSAGLQLPCIIFKNKN